jgi:hypothetical protein
VWIDAQVTKIFYFYKVREAFTIANEYARINRFTDVAHELNK